jgi:hypothetical protein
MAARGRPTDVRALLAHRDARFYLAGQALSTVGDNALWLAMGIWVKILTGSSSAAGLVFFAFTCGILLLIPPSLPVVLAAMGLLGLCIVWFNVGAITLIQRRTPADLLGRVDAALTIAITVPQTVSIALGAALVAVVNYRLLLATMTVVIVIAAAYLAGEPRARKSPESGAMPPASDGQSRVPVGNIG